MRGEAEKRNLRRMCGPVVYYTVLIRTEIVVNPINSLEYKKLIKEI